MAPESATVEDSGDLRVVWLDGHASTFSAAWLQEHAKATVPNTTTPRGWNPAWMAAQLEAHCTFAFEDVLARGGITGDWVQALQRYGLTKLTGAPQQSGQLSRLSRVLALPLRRTVYDEGGKETFQVQVKPGANNQAYTASALPLHSDLPFYEHPPAVQMLHCIQQDAGAGGASLFADGLAAVEQYRVSSPEGFRLLSTVPVLFDDVDPRTPSRYHLEAAHPVLQMDSATNQCVAVHINNGVRSTLMASDPQDVGQVTAHFAATREFRRLLASVFQFEQQAGPGDVWVFDNRRVLHGRAALTPECRARHLEGGYVEWDDLRSLLRLVGR